MNFLAAESLSSTNGMPVRREARDPDAWFILWRPPIWWIWDTGIWRQVKQTDYTADDLFADDWTTVPAPLAACPVTPTEPIGGGPPPPTFPGYPSIPGTPPGAPPPPPFGPPPGTGSGGGPSLPPPNPGTSLSITFTGLVPTSFTDVITGIDLNGPHPLEASGAGIWTATVESGTLVALGQKQSWDIEVTMRDGIYSASMHPSDGYLGPNAGGFSTTGPGPLHHIMPNDYDGAPNTYVVQGGSARVG